MRANIDPKYNQLLKSTQGVVFFATPHQGSDKAKYGDVLATVAAAVTQKAKTTMAAALREKSDFLFRLTDSFKFQTSSLKIVSFYELKPTAPSKTLVSCAISEPASSPFPC